VLTLGQPINAADRVTVTINNAALSFTGELATRSSGPATASIATFDNINGDGVVDMTDFNLVR
jgi:hypothetical protein